MNKEEKKAVEALKEQEVIIAYCCCGNKHTASANNSFTAPSPYGC